MFRICTKKSIIKQIYLEQRFIINIVFVISAKALIEARRLVEQALVVLRFVGAARLDLHAQRNAFGHVGVRRRASVLPRLLPIASMRSWRSRSRRRSARMRSRPPYLDRILILFFNIRNKFKYK